MNKEKNRIRPAGFEDAEAIFKLIKSYPQELIPRPLSDIVQNIDRALICEEDGRIIGTVSWQILPEVGVSRRHDVEIKSLAVTADARGKGIGRALVEAAIDRVRLLRTTEIVVLTFTPGFFQALGFESVPKETLIHKIYMGCINCTKYDSPFTCPEVAMRLLIKDE